MNALPFTPKTSTASLFLFVLAGWFATGTHAATFTVNSANDADDGACNATHCSLREAISVANATLEADVIAFSIGSGAQTIAPATALPAITQPVTIDGNSQPGFSGSPLIELNGVNTVSGSGDDGLLINAANCTIKGLVVNRFADNGIAIEGSGTGNKVQGCFIGTDASGTQDEGNRGRGIFIQTPGNTIGGTTAAARNVVSGNEGDGIQIFGSSSTGNLVLGNFLGTDKNGTADLGNGLHGVFVNNAVNTTIGGATAEARNVISGNDIGGIRASIVATGTKVLGNFIGLDKNGTADLGNNGTGVFLESNNNTIGGTSAGVRNVISGNSVHGVALVGAVSGNLVQGNFIGLDKNGVVAIGNSNSGVFIAAAATDNTVGGTVAGARNVISANSSDGISLRGSNNKVQGNFIGTDVNGTAKLGNGLHGVVLDGANNTVGGGAPETRNIISGNGLHGVQIFSSGATGNKVRGNFIGLDVTGTVALGNEQGGVLIENAAQNNIIGGTVAGQRNVISGNKTGINIIAGSSGNLVQGNLIGTDKNGVLDRGNLEHGVQIQESSGNTIGGTVVEARNTISGNDVNGVHIFGNAATGNLVQGNFIGLDKNGSAALGNKNGVFITAPGNTIGGAVAGARNVISGNNECGVTIFTNVAGNNVTGNQIQGNFIGLDSTGAFAIGNKLHGVLLQAASCTVGGSVAAARNVISGNAGDGVHLFSGISASNEIIGNRIGTDATGTAKVANGGNGIHLNGAGANTIGGTTVGHRNLISGNTQNGIVLIGAGSSQVLGNYIGLDVNGTAALGNTEEGVLIKSPNNVIGGVTSEAGNVISGNSKTGVTITEDVATGNLLQGNIIGLDKNGTAKLANAVTGVVVVTDNNTIGGTATGARNVISGNGTGGVRLLDASGVKVQGNFVGLDKTGTLALGNGTIGVIAQGGGTHLIGGLEAGARNVISGNGADGVQLANSILNLVQGNYVGTDVTGSVKLANGGHGVFAHESGSNTIGGTTVEARNVVSGNVRSGVNIGGGNATNNLVQGNYIGLRADGISSLANGEHGVVIGNNAGGDNNTIGGTVAGARNVISGNTGSGIVIQNATTSGNKVQGNIIGLNAAGTGDAGNNNHGIFVSLAVNTTIGGSGAARNIISGNNFDGVRIFGGGIASTTLVQNNFIGTDVTGTQDRGNDGNGIFIDRAFNNTIGGTTSGTGNVISGNLRDGVLISGATGNVLQGNRIGVKATSSQNLGNTGNGVRLTAFATINTIGGNDPGTGNTIAFNGGDGVFVEFAGGVAIQRNFIHSNSGLGIDLEPNGVNANDSGDGDTGSNGRQNFPIITEALSGLNSRSIKGSLSSKPNTTYRLEFFSNTESDPSGNGEGASFLGTTNVTTGANGITTFNFSPTSLSSSSLVSATATDPSGSTSEFSPCVPVNAADLQLIMTDTPDPVTALEVLTYNILVTSNGPALSLPKVTDILPAGVEFVSATTTQGTCSQADGTVTCTLNSMSRGDNVGITIKVRPQASGTLTNTATVSSNRPDTNPNNNSFTATTSVIPRVDLSLSKIAAPNPAAVGQDLVYTLTITNLGRRDAAGMTLIDDLPDGVEFVSATPAPASHVGRRLRFILGELAVGAQRQVTIRVRPQEVGTITNSARVNLLPGQGDPDLSNNTASATVQVESACAEDVSQQVEVTRGQLQFSGDIVECFAGRCRFTQQITLRNKSAHTLRGPVALALDNLNPKATLLNADGETSCAAPSGSPFVQVSAQGLVAGATATVTLEFQAEGYTNVTYDTRVLAGTP